MDQKYCFYCDKDERLDNLMIHVCELSGSDLYFNLNQSHLGRVIVASKIHVKEIFELSSNQRECFINDISLTSKVIQSIFCPDKINYAVFGDIVNHLHMHIVPKYKSKKNWGEPYNDKDPFLLNPQESTKLINKIRAVIKITTV